MNIRREDVSIIFYVLVGLFDCIVFKWRFSEQKGVHDDSYRPDVDFVAVSLLFKDFGCYIVGSATNGFFAVSLIFDFGAETEIADFGVHELVDEDVTEFEVSMDDTLGVNIDHGFDNLSDVDSGLELG